MLRDINALNEQVDAAKKAMNIASDKTFDAWLVEECEYLRSIRVESNEDILAMEYLKTLKQLQEAL